MPVGGSGLWGGITQTLTKISGKNVYVFMTCFFSCLGPIFTKPNEGQATFIHSSVTHCAHLKRCNVIIFYTGGKERIKSVAITQ